MFQKLSAVLFAALFAMGLVCLVIGLAQNDGNRLVPGGLLMIFATLSGAGAYDLLTSGRMIVRRTLWSNECEWRDRREVPIRHWSGLIILSLASLGSAAFAGAFFLGLKCPRIQIRHHGQIVRSLPQLPSSSHYLALACSVSCARCDTSNQTRVGPLESCFSFATFSQMDICGL